MARQAGPIYFTGTIDDITFYKMEGTYFARKKSSLDRKQFRTDPRFARSRKSAAKFGEASKLASDIYHLLPKEEKKKGVIGKLTGQMGRLLREGKHAEEIIQHFKQHYQPTTAKPVNQTHEKDTAPVQMLSESWKITSNGKLIGQKLIKLPSTDAISSFSSSAILNGYIAPKLE
jgi:hypothetical protein